MKTFRFSIPAILRPAIFLGCAFLAGTALGAQKVGVLIGDVNSPFGTQLQAAFSELAAERGIPILIKAPPSAESVPQMQRMLSAWAGDPDIAGLIVAAGLGAQELGSSLQMAATRGLPVVGLLGRLPAAVVRSTVLVDEATLAVAVSEECLKRIDAKSEVAMLRSNLRGSEMNDRERLLIAALHERYPELPVHADVFMNGDGVTPVQQARLLLKKHPQTTLVYSPYTTATAAVIEALHDRPALGKIAHVGIGAKITPESEAAFAHGELSALILISPRDVADKALQAISALRNGQHPPETIYSEIQVVTREGAHAVTPVAR